MQQCSCVPGGVNHRTKNPTFAGTLHLCDPMLSRICTLGSFPCMRLSCVWHVVPSTPAQVTPGRGESGSRPHKRYPLKSNSSASCLETYSIHPPSKAPTPICKKVLWRLYGGNGCRQKMLLEAPSRCTTHRRRAVDGRLKHHCNMCYTRVLCLWQSRPT